METYIQITSGKGPVECCWVVAKVLKYFLEDVHKKGIHEHVVSRVKGPENGTLYAATIRLEGTASILNPFISSWVGTILWVSNSKHKQLKKKKNWFIQIEEVKVDKQHLDSLRKGIVYQSIKSGGPGGQHVNKSNTAIRAIHLTSGLSVLASDSRSQYQNKKLATDRLIKLVNDKFVENLKSTLQSNLNSVEIKRKKPTRVFKGSHFKRKPSIKPFKSTRQKLKREIKTEF